MCRGHPSSSSGSDTTRGGVQRRVPMNPVSCQPRGSLTQSDAIRGFLFLGSDRRQGSPGASTLHA